MLLGYATRPSECPAVVTQIRFDTARFRPVASASAVAGNTLGRSTTFAGATADYTRVCKYPFERRASAAPGLIFVQYFIRGAYDYQAPVPATVINSWATADARLSWDAESRLLSWRNFLIPDGDQDGYVGLADLMPQAVYFNQDTTQLAPQSVAYLIDGNEDGKVTVQDLSPIALHFSHGYDGFNVYVFDPGWSDSELAGYVPLSSGVGEREFERLSFSLSLADEPPASGSQIWLCPVLGGQEGPATSHIIIP
jgi:hypothetical protein